MEIFDPFTFSTGSLAELSLREGRIVMQPFGAAIGWQQHIDFISVRMAPVALLIILNKITAISSNTLLFQPINGILYIFLAYVLGLAFCQSKRAATLYAAIMAFDVTVIEVTNNIFYESLGYSLLMTFLILCLRALRSRTRSIISLMLLVFVTLYFTYYSMEFIALALTIGLSLLLVLTKRRMKPESQSSRALFVHLALCLTVIFLSFDSIVYQYLSSHGSGLEVAVGYSVSYLSYLSQALMKSGGAIERYSSGEASPPYFHVTELTYRVLLPLPIVAFLLLRLVKKLNVSPFWKKSEIVYLSLTFSALAHFVVYLTYPVLNVISMYILFPLLALYSIQELPYLTRRLKLRSIGRALIIAILLIGLMRFPALLADPGKPSFTYSVSEPSITFLISHLGEGTDSVVSTHQISGYTTYISTRLNKHVFTFTLGQDAEALYSHNSDDLGKLFARREYDFILLPSEITKKPLFASAWSIRPPAPEASFLFNANTAFDRIYDDHRVYTFFYSPKM